MNRLEIKVDDRTKRLRFGEMLTTGSRYAVEVTGGAETCGADAALFLSLPCGRQVAVAELSAGAGTLDLCCDAVMRLEETVPFGTPILLNAVLRCFDEGEEQNVAVGQCHAVAAWEGRADSATGTVVRWKGEKGEKGEKGDKGDKGDPGEKGEPGEAPDMAEFENMVAVVESALSAETVARVRGDHPLDGYMLNTNTANAMRQAVKAIGTALGATMRVVAVCAALPLLGASVQTAPLGELDLDENPHVVTNVDFSGLARIEDIPPADLAPATNYTDEAVSGLAGDIQDGSLIAQSASEAEVARSLLGGGGVPVSGADVLASLDTKTTTNDVCNIVTNEVEEWQFASLKEKSWVLGEEQQISEDAIISVEYVQNGETIWEYSEPHDTYWKVVWNSEMFGGVRRTGYDPDKGPETAEINAYMESARDECLKISRRKVTSNALGLARQSDIPTNTVTREEMEAAIDGIPAPDLSRFATKESLAAVSNEAQVVYRLFSGSNVICEVTNYNSRVNPPALSIMQLSESNTYFNVWTETNGLARTFNAATNDAAQRVKAATAALPATYAPRAWCRTTSGLGEDAPTNTTWISTPTTVIAGGLEYAKVVHSGGEIWVLSGNGMVNFDPTTNAYLRISADDGKEIFSIEKTDAVTVGAFADGITVDDSPDFFNVIDIPVNVVSEQPPDIFWRHELNDSAGWKDMSAMADLDIDVEMGGQSGAWMIRVFMPKTYNISFFKFEYLKEGSTLIKNGAPMDVSGGIMCTDGIHKVRPVYSNGTVTWEVVQ